MSAAPTQNAVGSPIELPVGVESAIHPVEDPDQPDGVHVEDRRRVHIVSRSRRVAGHRQDIPDVHGVGAEHIGLDPHQVPVATGEVHRHVEARRVAHQDRRREHGHPHAAEGTVVDVHDLDAAFLEELGALHQLLDVVAARRIQLDGDEELARVETTLEDRERRRRRERRRVDHLHARTSRRGDLGDGPARRDPVHGLAHRADMLGRGAAAPADHPRPGRDHARRVLGHVRGRREIDQPLARAARQTRVGLDHDGETSGLGQHLFQDVVQHARAHGAVRSHSLHGQLAKGSRHLAWRATEERHPVVGECDLADDRQFGDRADRLDRETHLHQIGERLHDERVHSALDEPFRLLAERGARLVRLDGSKRREVFPERTDRAEDEHVAAHALADVPCEPGAAPVDLANASRQAVHSELEAVGAEGVGLDAVGARRDVLGMDALHELRVIDAQDVEACVQGHATRIEHRAHGAIAEERTLEEPRDERRDHHRAVRSRALRSRERKAAAT